MMQRILLILPALVAILSCNKEQPIPNNLFEMEFQASREAIEKSCLSSGKDVIWEKGDEISVFDGTENRKFSTSEKGPSARFKGIAGKTGSYLMTYPYSKDVTFGENCIHTFFQTIQEAVPGNFSRGANVSAGISLAGKNDVMMRNAGALICFTLPEQSYDISEVKIETLDGTPLSGECDITLSDGIPSTKGSANAVNFVSLRADSAIGSGEYYAVVIPGTAAFGFRMDLILRSGGRLRKENPEPVSYTRNEIVDFGTLDLNGFTLLEDTPSDTSPDPESAFASYGVDFSRLVSAGHPRLFMSDADFLALRRRVVLEKDPSDDVYLFHQAIMTRAETVYRKIANELTYIIDENGNLLDVSNEGLERLLCFSYAFRITSDVKWLDAARHDLATVCAFKDWFDSDMMCPSEMSLGVAVAYDWLYYYLTAEEKAAAERALKDFELVPFSTYSVRTDSNWNQSTCGGAVVSAIAIYDKCKSLSASCIDKALTKNKQAVKNIFYPHGGGKEGPSYCGYTVTFEGVILQAIKSAFGTCCEIDTIEGLEKNGEWFQFMDGSAGSFNFSDASSEEMGAEAGVVFLAAHYGRPDILLREKEVMKRSAKYTTSRFAPLSVIWLFKNPFPSGAPDYPASHVWSCNGDSPMVLTRIGWTYGESDSYVAMKAAAGYSSHSHLDGGEFVFDAFGCRWASDTRMGPYAGYKNDINAMLGKSLFTYASQMSLRWDILCQNNYFHNTLSFTWSSWDIKPEPTAADYNIGSGLKLHVTDQITNKPCSVVETYDSSAEEGYGGRMDLSDHYSDAASSVFRSSRLFNDSVHIIDEITSRADHSAPFEWRMVTKADATLGDGCIVLNQNGRTMYLYCIASGDVSIQPQYGIEEKIVRPAGWAPRGWDGYQSYDGFHVVKFSAEVPAGVRKGVFKTVISPLKPGDSGIGIGGEKPGFEDVEPAGY